MGIGVLEDRYLDRPPGTSKLGEDDQKPVVDSGELSAMRSASYYYLVANRLSSKHQRAEEGWRDYPRSATERLAK